MKEKKGLGILERESLLKNKKEINNKEDEGEIKNGEGLKDK
jgi:hypothetical protein